MTKYNNLSNIILSIETPQPKLPYIERRCICIKTGRNEDSESGYEQMCGNCRDPCQLKFTPDRVSRYLQTLAAQEANNDYEEF